MRKFTLIVIALASFVVSKAQEAESKKCSKSCCDKACEKKPNKYGWTFGGSVVLMGSQGGSKNWAPGAERFSLAANSMLQLYAKRQHGRCNWTTLLSANYGLVKTSNGGFRKNDDRVDLYTKYTFDHRKKPTWSWGVVANLRSQFTDGFKYDYDPNGNMPFSSWFAPATLTFAPGFEVHRKDKKFFQLFVSPIAYRSIIVANKPYSIRNVMALANGSGVVDPQTGYVSAASGKSAEFDNTLPYGVNPGQKARHEVGPYINLNYEFYVMKNVMYSSRLDLFSNLINSDVNGTNTGSFGSRLKDGRPGNIDVFWTNTFTMKVNNYLSVVYNLDLVYDDNTRNFTYSNNKADLQVKSILGIGFAAKF
jgi:hypothetical protein